MKKIILKYKAKKLLKESKKALHVKSKLLSSTDKNLLTTAIENLQNSLNDNSSYDSIKVVYKELEIILQSIFSKSLFQKIYEIFIALIFSLLIAISIRYFIIELYQVPTGSMRPTIFENDRIAVSKTTFGIKIPFINKPLLQPKDSLKRNGIIVFSVKNMPVSNPDMIYFKIFKGKKRFVKRCIALPEDHVYFYGGQTFIVDKDNNIIVDNDNTILHVPIINFEGKPFIEDYYNLKANSSMVGLHMGIPTIKYPLYCLKSAQKGQFFDGHQWKYETFNNTTKKEPNSFYDLWGIKNYAGARILTSLEVEKIYNIPQNEIKEQFILELSHHPRTKNNLKINNLHEVNNSGILISTSHSFIPLNENHLEKIKQSLFSSRFIIKNGYLQKLDVYKNTALDKPLKFIDKIPNGCYEFRNGCSYKIYSYGFSKKLEPSHPLNNLDFKQIRFFFNYGVDFENSINFIESEQNFFPQRFAFFNNKELFLLNTPVFNIEDEALKSFIHDESTKTNNDLEPDYRGFQDYGAPIDPETGLIDINFIKSFGLKIPKDHILALGDNYAMSSDSRDFGFVPIENILGAPIFKFWPIDSCGFLPQTTYGIFTSANIVIYSCFISIIIAYQIIKKVRSRNKYDL